MRTAIVGCVAAGVSFLLFSGHQLSAQAPVNYHLIKTVSLPQAPGNREYFDYLRVDNDARRVYVSHGTEMDVLNVSAGLGLTIPGSAFTGRNKNFSSKEKK